MEHRKQSEVKYTTPTFKALKIRFRALENDTKKQDHLTLLFCLDTVDTKQLTPCSPKIDTENTLFL